MPLDRIRLFKASVHSLMPRTIIMGNSGRHLTEIRPFPRQRQHSVYRSDDGQAWQQLQRCVDVASEPHPKDYVSVADFLSEFHSVGKLESRPYENWDGDLEARVGCVTFS